MVLGLLRILVLDIWGAVSAYSKAGDKRLAWGDAFRKTVSWLFPLKRGFTKRPLYSAVSIFFHIGLIVTPIFLFAHIQLWDGSLGFSWWSLSDFWADLLTLATVVFGMLLFLGRIGSRNARFLSRKQDYMWPLLLIVPFVTGYVCSNFAISARSYEMSMLIHIVSGELIFVLIPFTKIAHCAIMPLSQFVVALCWKFPARVDRKIARTLDKEGAPV